MIKHHQASSSISIITHHHAASRIINHHQAASRIMKHHQASSAPNNNNQQQQHDKINHATSQSPDQLHQELLRMKERRKNALEFLKTKTQVPENAAQRMSYQKIDEHLDQIRKLESNSETATHLYVIQENGNGQIRRDRTNNVRGRELLQNNQQQRQLNNHVSYLWIDITEATSLNENLLDGVKNIKLRGRLEELKAGKLKKVIGKNKIFCDGGHNIGASRSLAYWIKQQNQDVHVVVGMMRDKAHKEFINHLANVAKSITLIDIPNQEGSISKEEFKKKLGGLGDKILLSNDIKDVLIELSKRKNSICLITGSLYLVGEIYNLN